jgi:hypothetical protein
LGFNCFKSWITRSTSSVLTANVNFLSGITTGATVAIGATQIFVSSVTGVSVGSSLTVDGKLTNVPIVAVASTSVFIGTGSTIGTTIVAGTASTFSTRTNATKLRIDVPSGFVGVVVISSFTLQFGDVIVRNVGGAGTAFSGVGIGTTTLTVA